MRAPLSDETVAVYRDRLARARAIAALRLRRLARELDHLTRKLGDRAPSTERARQRRDRQTVVLDALQRRHELLASGRS